MDAEFSVELGADDPTLAVPWNTPDGATGYVDLKVSPEAMNALEEVRDFPELAGFLRALNACGAIYETAKCDVWLDTLMDVDDEPYEATVKCGSYVDLFFREPYKLAAFAEHERRARDLVQRLRKCDDLPARAEVIIRRAYFSDDEGLYWTVYLFGYGDDAESAQARWGCALNLLRTAMLQ